MTTRPRSPKWARLLSFTFGLAVLACFGCPNPNTYTTPRTVGHGRFTHSIAPEAWGFTVSGASGGSLSGTLPTVPTYTVRAGLGDRLELGGRLANLSSIGADVKANFIRSSRFDLAIDPSIQYFRISTGSTGVDSTLSVGYLHLPVLLGFNLSRTVTLVLAPGVSYGFASASVDASSAGQDQASATSGTIGRLGVGFDFRISPWFALHPELTFLRSFGTNPTLLYMFGVGFNFGAMPNYDDVDGTGPGSGPPGTAPPPPPAYPPPAYPPPAYPPPAYPPPA